MKKQSKYLILFLFLILLKTPTIAQFPATHVDSLKISIDTLENEAKGHRYFEIARHYLSNQPQPDSFRLYIGKTGSFAKLYDDKDLLFNFHYYNGIFHHRASRLETSMNYMDSAETVCKFSEDSISIAKMLFAKSILHDELGENEKFEQGMLRVIEIAKKINNVTLHTSSLVVLSQQAKKYKLYDQQYELLSEAYTLFDASSPYTRLKILTQLGSYHSHEYKRNNKIENLNASIDFIDRGILLADSLGNRVALTDLWIKTLHLKDISNNIDAEYLSLAQKVLESGKQMQDPFFIYKGYLLTGMAYNEMNQPKKVLEQKDVLLKYAKILKGQIYMQESYNLLKDAATKAGELPLALHYSEQFIIYTDSINVTEKAEAFTNAIQKYEREKKEKEILLLSKQKQQAEFESKQKEDRLKQNLLYFLFALLLILSIVYWNHNRQNQKLIELQYKASQNEQKLLRSQMNPHFLFNSLNSIKRFYIEGRTEEANDFMADFGNLLRQILEQSSKPFISIEEELEFLTLYLELEKRRFKKALNYTINFDPNEFDFEDQIPSLILQPLVENSIWHGIMKGDRDGEITITVEKDGSNIKCSVVDNGIGYFSENKSKNHTYTSKGLQLVKDRVGKNGKFQISSIFDKNGEVKGTLATLIFNTIIE